MRLLERDACLDELDMALQDAVGGEGRVTLVSGEAGIGKTSLVAWFVRERRSSVEVLWGACDALFTPRPLGPLHDMAAQTHGHLPALLNSDANRTTIFSTVLSELQGRPAIAVFEDVHWADEATLDLLRFLGRPMARTAALLVMTYWDDELGLRHPLRSVLGDLATLPSTRRVPLRPLTETAVRTLIGERAIDAVALHRQTGGNPFFVTEVLASVGGGLPPSIRDAVLARTARLSLSAQAVLQAAAVIGPRIESWVLAEVSGTEIAAADECLAIGVLLAQGEALAFRHELARQAILESISPHRMALHRMALDALKTSPATRHDLSRLAHHAEAASDREAVLEYAPAAAKQAAAAGAHREAASLSVSSITTPSLTPFCTSNTRRGKTRERSRTVRSPISGTISVRTEHGATPSLRLLHLRQQFPSQWHRFLHPATPADGNVFELDMAPSLFPIRDQEKTLKINTIWLLARCTDAASYEVVMTPPMPAPPPAESNTMTLARVSQYGGLHFGQKDVAAAGIRIVPTALPVKWQLRMTRPGGGNLQEDPVEVKDLLFVLGYEWE
jgi:AAA ATPase-like protein